MPGMCAANRQFRQEVSDENSSGHRSCLVPWHYGENRKSTIAEAVAGLITAAEVAARGLRNPACGCKKTKKRAAAFQTWLEDRAAGKVVEAQPTL